MDVPSFFGIVIASFGTIAGKCRFVRVAIGILMLLNPSSYHMCRRAAVLLLVVVSVCLDVSTALADRAKRTGIPKTPAVSSTSVLRYSTPLYGALEATLLALNQNGLKKQNTAPLMLAGTTTVQQAPKTPARDTDTSRRENKIIFARATADQFSTKVELVDEQAVIDVGIYNMLGKKVIDVYRGGATKGPHDYSVGVSDLPEGVYICILQGENFRRAEKFYLSR
jgi:hypothetical protein